MPEPYLAAATDLSLLTKWPATSPALLLALERASNRFRDEVGYPVHLVTDDVVLLNGRGGEILLLPAAPCTDLTVEVDGAVITDYECDHRNGVLYRAARWPRGYSNIEVTFTHGWDPVPGGIQDAVLEQAAIGVLVPSGVQSESTGTQSITWGHQATTGVTEKWAAAVARYRLSGDRT